MLEFRTNFKLLQKMNIHIFLQIARTVELHCTNISANFVVLNIVEVLRIDGGNIHKFKISTNPYESGNLGKTTFLNLIEDTLKQELQSLV